MKDQLLSYEIDAITGAISVKKRKYTTEIDEFGIEITKSTDWRGVVACGDEKSLPEHFNNKELLFIKSIWTPEMRNNRKALEAKADKLNNIPAR